MSRTSIPFRGFDDRGDVRIYDHGILPQGRQTGCTYFVTFRLADSIPRKVLEEIEHERRLWLRARGIDPDDLNWKQRLSRLPIVDQRLYERLVGKLVNKSLDECHGTCVLRDPSLGSKVAESLVHFHEIRIFTGDFVVVPNHVHVLLTPCNGYELEDVLHSIKSFTANEINRALNKNGALWQRESYDHIVRDLEQLHAYKDYIAANPSKARLRSGEFVHSQAEYRELT